MLIFLLIWICAIWEVNFKRPESSLDFSGIYILLVCLLIIFAGIRRVGFDFDNYLNLYEHVRLNNFAEYTIEPGFAALISLSNYIYSSFGVFVFLIAFASICLKSVFFFNNSPYVFVSLLLYFSITFLISDMGQIRNGLAIAIALSAFQDGFEKNHLAYFGKTVLAILCHSSAIIILPAYWLIRTKYVDIRSMLLYLGLSCVFLIIDIRSMLFLLAENLPIFQIQAKIAFYATSEEFGEPLGLNISLLLRLFILLIMVVYRNRACEVNSYFPYIIKLYAFGVCLYMIFNSIAEFSIRFSNYFKVLECIILPIFIVAGKGRTEKNLITFLVGLYATYSIYKILADAELGSAYLPYETILSLK